MTPQFVQGVIIGGIIMIIFLVIAFTLIKRNRTRISISLAFYFISVAAGLVFNIIYRLLEYLHRINFDDNRDIFTYGNIFTIYFTTFAGIFLLHFNLTLFYSTKIYSRKLQNWITSLYAIILLGLIVIQILVPYYGSLYGVSWDEGRPTWGKIYGYYFLVVSQIVFIFILVYALKISKKMGKNKYSKKYLRNIIGILFFDIQLIGAFLANTYYPIQFTSDFGMRDLGAIIQIIGILIGTPFLALGLKKEPET